MRRNLPRLLTLWLLVGCFGCASTPSAPRPGQASELGLEGVFIDAQSGRELSRNELAARLEAAQVVLVGERHGDPAHHRLQAELGRWMARSLPGRTVAAVEWLPWSARFAIAGWMASEAAVGELRRAVSWDRAWGHAFEAYAPFFELLRAAAVPIFPINAEAGLARAIARGTPLPPEDAALLPPLTSGFETHRVWFAQQMAQHHGGPHHGASFDEARLERLYRAQLVWDETMARHVSGLLDGQADRVLVSAGQGHTTRGLGIPARLGPHAWIVIHALGGRADLTGRVARAPYPEREADLFWLPGESITALARATPRRR